MGSRPRVALMLDLHYSLKHHTAVFAGAMDYADEHHWQTFVDEYAGDTLPATADAELPYDGVIARATKKLIDRAEKLQLPVVNVYYSSPHRARLPGVFPDNPAIARIAAEHLLTRGFIRFAALTAKEDLVRSEQCHLLQQLVEQSGYTCSVCQVSCGPNETPARWKQTKQALSSWMDTWEPPIAVFLGAEFISQTVVQLCRSRGWRIPQDVAIVAGRNEDSFCQFCRPPVTSVEIGYERIGYEAARLLDQLMAKRGRSRSSPKAAGARPQLTRKKPQHKFVPPQGLIPRESTDFYTTKDPDVAKALAFIAENSHRPIRVDDIAAAVALETRTLRNRFEKHLGRTMVDEIRRVRIERAKRELVQGDATMTEIAHAVGFRDANRMYEVFAREVGVSPTQFRKERRVSTKT